MQKYFYWKFSALSEVSFISYSAFYSILHKWAFLPYKMGHKLKIVIWFWSNFDSTS